MNEAERDRAAAGPPFAAAAAALMAGTPRAALAPGVRALLDAFGLQAEDPVHAAADGALLRIAARLDRVFRLPVPEAPGLVALGAEMDLAAAAGEPAGALPPASASGVGETPAAALRACLGEAAEFLASVETAAARAAMRPAPPPDAAADPALTALLDGLPWPEGARETFWAQALRMTDGTAIWLPRELLFRIPETRRGFAPPWPLSLGCAAGATPEQAALHALLELVERDAVALWWRGGMPARALALEEQARAGLLLARLRRDRAGQRRSWLLDITTELAVPVVAAVSFAPDGSGFCCGFAARSALADAAEAAVRELLQMELAQHLVAAKAAARGEAALNPRDHAHRRRFAGVHAARCALVHPALPPTAPDATALLAADAPAAETLGALVQRLAAHGLAPLLFDHTAYNSGGVKICVPVVRMLCPGLETETAPTPGARLRSAIARHGGGAAFREGIGLT